MSFRTYESGAAKWKKAKRVVELIKSQKGDIHKFLKSNTGVSINPNNELAIVAVEEEQLCIEKQLLDDIETLL